MTKLIQNYRNAPGPINGKKIIAYVRKHPMSLCMLPAEDIKLINSIIEVHQPRVEA